MLNRRFNPVAPNIACATDITYMRQHFHNYFELLLGAERSKLQHAIANANAPSEQHEIVVEIDYRINYLRGAVRMGKLLCLIDQEEAKAHLDVLSSERDRLRAGALGGCANPHCEAVPNSTSRIASIRKSLRTTA